MKIDTDDKKIEELLTRGVEEAIDADHLRNKLKSGKQLRIKLGIDPTSPNIHIGRSIPLLKLKDFQELGHKIVLIIGDFTGIIGDTSDKDSERPMLAEAQVAQNMKTYVKQVAKILDIRKCEVRYNSEWLGKLKYQQIGEQADAFSLNEFISRENIAKRLNDGKRISLRELLYPLMQGYDSVAIKADVEIGGTDQRFNLLAGRALQKKYGQEPQDIITNPLIEGLDGRKMSSSWGNTINLFEPINEMYGKIMSLHDELIIKYLTLTTRINMIDIESYRKQMEVGANPRDYKMKLAFEIVKSYYSEQDAQIAQEYFIRTFSNKETPDVMPEITPTKYDIVTIMIEAGLSPTKADARRLIEQHGVRVNKDIVKDETKMVEKGDVVQKGKRFFIKVM